MIFDLDGTLTVPMLNFDAIRAEIGLPAGPILEAMEQMEPADRARAETILNRHERLAAEGATLHDGAVEVVARLRASSRPVAVLTRNARPWTQLVLDRFGIEVDAVRTREDGAVKPSAEPVLSICSQLGARPSESWMVGDFLFDILSGRAAGTRTVLMISDGQRPAFADQADYVIRSLWWLLRLVE